MPKNAQNFDCVLCDFKCSKKSNYEEHLRTDKHKNRENDDKMMINDDKKMPKNADDLFSCDCGKQYKHYSGLWRHQNEKKCKKDDNNQITMQNLHDNPMDIIVTLIKQNQDFQNLIMEQNKCNYELQKQLIGISKEHSQNITNNNNTINSHNKTFNLQFFLNETCKDAMNMSDFINSMKLQLSDLESVGKLGFVDGISNIIIKNLQALDVEKRPVHCSDSKRETMYIKDQDKWEKEDDEFNRMRQMVRQVRDKNISLITSWRDLYPECLLSNSKKTDQYNNICMESFGFKKEKEQKIISKIAKSVVIDKRE
jgi:hypothetical protein